MTWEKISAGGMDGRMKKWLGNGRRIRVLEISPRWKEADWCQLGHSAYVLNGKLRLHFKSTSQPMEVSKGQGFTIPIGSKHKASCSRTTLVFMVDDLPNPGE